MRGLGTIINVIGVVAGGILGCLIGNRLKENIRKTLLTVNGVAVVVIGLAGALSQMFTVADGRLQSNGTIMLVVCLAAGAVVGELLKIEDGVNRFGSWLKVKSHSTGDASFVGGFVTASCTITIGAMAILGGIQDGISGDYSILAAKAIIDAITVCVMAASLGKGCVFAAIPMGIWQGLFTLLAVFAGDFLPAAVLDSLSMVGSVLIMCVGLNLVRKDQIRVANLLPALVFAVIWGFFL